MIGPGEGMSSAEGKQQVALSLYLDSFSWLKRKGKVYLRCLMPTNVAFLICTMGILILTSECCFKI